MEPNEELKGLTWLLGITTFLAVSYTVWKGLDIFNSLIIVILSLWGFWLFAVVFDYILPKILGDTKSRWIRRGAMVVGFLFCLFTFYTCEKGIEDNKIVYYNKDGKIFHYNKECSDINEEIPILQSRRADAERDGLKPCYCCDDDIEDEE